MRESSHGILYLMCLVNKVANNVEYITNKVKKVEFFIIKILACSPTYNNMGKNLFIPESINSWRG